jgi:hypothetical protein
MRRRHDACGADDQKHEPSGPAMLPTHNDRE